MRVVPALCSGLSDVAFFDDMAAMAADLLKPDIAGGLGTGAVTLSRTTPGTPTPDKPWLPTTPTTKTEQLKAAVFGVNSRLVGTEASSTVIQASDREAICTVPEMGYQSGDVLTVDGKEVVVISFERIPAAGTAVAVKFVIRG